MPIRPKSQRAMLIKRDGLQCHWCGRICNPEASPHTDLFPTRDHVIRKADGGSNSMKNLVLACRQCNNERHNEYWSPSEYVPVFVPYRFVPYRFESKPVYSTAKMVNNEFAAHYDRIIEKISKKINF